MNPSYRERPVQFGNNKGLFGILCMPSGATAVQGPVVVIPNSGVIHRVGANRIYVELARSLADQGIRSLRLDLSGIGESERRAGEISLDESVHRDLTEAFDFLAARHNAKSFAMLGLCSGAYDGLQQAVKDRRVVGVVAIDVFGSFRNKYHILKHYFQRLLSYQSWRNALSEPGDAVMALFHRAKKVDDNPAPAAPPMLVPTVRPMLSHPELESMLHTMDQQQVQSLFLFTGGLEENYNYEHQFRDCYPTQVRSGRVAYGFIPHSNHSFTNPKDREALVSKVTAWFADTAFEHLPPAAVPTA
jgi:hypothetical protein